MRQTRKSDMIPTVLKERNPAKRALTGRLDREGVQSGMKGNRQEKNIEKRAQDDSKGSGGERAVVGQPYDHE